MSYTLRVLFSGLCAFVPERPFEGDDPGAVTVLLPNLLRPKTLSNAAFAEINEEEGDPVLDPHYPLVEFDLDDLHPFSPRQADLRRNSTGKGVCLLLGEDVSFDVGGAPQGLRIPASAQLLEGADFREATLHWLASLEKAKPGSVVKPSCLTDDLTLKGEPPILARVKLNQGFLRTSFEPREAGDLEYEQQIATELALDIEGVEGVSAIVFKRADGTEQRLLLQPRAHSTRVEIRIQNMELVSPARELSDFEIFYALLREPRAGS